MPVIHLLLAIYYLLAGPVLAALLLAWVVAESGLAGLVLSPWGLALAPLLYFFWLLLTLAVCALDVQLWSRTIWKRPARLDTSTGLPAWWRGYLTLTLILRGRLIMSLPGVKFLQLVPIVRQLVFLSYAPRTSLGKDSLVFGFLYDPDQVIVGEGAILGAGSIISTHSFIANPHGGFTYHSSPVMIGSRAIIGGESRLALGVQVGADSIVEPASNVLPHTIIPSGEVWGGHPAVFVRARSGGTRRVEDTNTVAEHESGRHSRGDHTPATSSDELTQALRELLARSLQLPVESIHSQFSRQDSANWDSLAQMAIAAGMHARFGISVPTAVCFALDSLPEIERYIRANQSGIASATPQFTLPSNPEILPLCDHQVATRALLNAGEGYGTGNPPHRLRVVIASSFTAEPLAESFRFWARPFGIELDLEFAGFNQIQQQLRDPESLFHRNTTGLNIVITRPEDLWSNPPASGGSAADDLLAALQAFCQNSPDRLAVATLPLRLSGDAASSDQMRQNWNRSLAEIPGCDMLDFAGLIDRLGTERAGNPDGEVLAGIPYSDVVYLELGVLLARHARRTIRPSKKVIVLDCDGVLWGGVLGEEGADGITLGPTGTGHQFQRFQERLLEIRSRGVLLTIRSRNELEDVQQVFANHPGMVLRPEHITAWKVDWRPKSAGIEELSRELNLGLDAFVFIDDDIANQLEVAARLPQVCVLPVPVEGRTFLDSLDRLWCFDSPRLTREDARRSDMVREEQDRQKLREQSGDLQSYLASLEMQVRMWPATMEDLPRAAQLTQKTNQFNLSLKRRSLGEMQSLLNDHAVHLVQAQDRYGDYGVVGLAISRPGHDALLIDTFLLSCRALGRGVEQAMLFGLREYARERGLGMFRADVSEGPRNAPARDFAHSAGFVPCVDEPGCMQLPVELATLPSHLSWEGPV